MSTDERVLEILYQEWGEDYRGILTPDSSPGDVEAWDSLSAVRVLLSLEQAFALRITTDEALAMDTVGKIQHTIRAKTNGSR